MSSVGSLEQLYTSAPIVDYEEDDRAAIAPDQEEDEVTAGLGRLGPEAFDAAILAALIAP